MFPIAVTMHNVEEAMGLSDVRLHSRGTGEPLSAPRPGDGGVSNVHAKRGHSGLRNSSLDEFSCLPCRFVKTGSLVECR